MSRTVSPSFAFRRSVSSASPLVDRVTRLASPAETKVSCHPLRVAAVVPSARERISRSSPPQQAQDRIALALARHAPTPTQTDSVRSCCLRLHRHPPADHVRSKRCLSQLWGAA